jgi:hypothetical protein
MLKRSLLGRLGNETWHHNVGYLGWKWQQIDQSESHG